MDEKNWQVAVVGAGPAGLFAATTIARRKKSVLLISKEKHSTRLSEADKVDNYPGLLTVSGMEISQKLWEQVDREKVPFISGEVQIISPIEQGYQLFTRQEIITAESVVLATGVKLRGQLPGEKEFVGKGVSYCANCDAMFFRGKPVAVIGYTREEGEEEANFMADLCPTVYYLPQYKQEVGELKPNVSLVAEKPSKIEGSNKVERLETIKKRILEVEGVFIIRESLPPNELLPGLVLHEEFIGVDRQQATNLPGVFAAGDCTGRPWQIARAIGEGQVAALSVAKFLDEKARI